MLLPKRSMKEYQHHSNASFDSELVNNILFGGSAANLSTCQNTMIQNSAILGDEKTSTAVQSAPSKIQLPTVSMGSILSKSTNSFLKNESLLLKSMKLEMGLPSGHKSEFPDFNITPMKNEMDEQAEFDEQVGEYLQPSPQYDQDIGENELDQSKATAVVVENFTDAKRAHLLYEQLQAVGPNKETSFD